MHSDFSTQMKRDDEVSK